MEEQLNLLWTRLNDSEYLHVLLGEIPLYGIFFGLIFFIGSLLFKSKQIQVMSLVTLIAACGMTHFNVKQRKVAQPHVSAMQNTRYEEGFKDMTTKRENSSWIYWALGALAIFSVSGRKTRFGGTAVGLTIVWGVVTLIFSTWVHMRDAEITQPNILLDPAAEARMVKGAREEVRAKQAAKARGPVVQAVLPAETNPTGHRQ